MVIYSHRTLSFLRSALLLISAVLFTACASAAEESVRQQAAPDIFVIGDIHGDYDAYMAVLRDAELVDKKGRWSGGKARLVQTGDVPDRGPETRKILDHLMKLEKQAARKGGAVIALIGNHEAMNITGDLRYVTPSEYQAFVGSKSKQARNKFYTNNREAFATKYQSPDVDTALDEAQLRAAFDRDYPLGYVEHRRAWGPNGKYGAWVMSHDALHIMDDTLFLHGGLSQEYITLSVDEINHAIRDALQNDPQADILNGDNSPLWYRGNAIETQAGAAEIAALLDTYDVARIIIGHTPQTDGIKTLYDGKVIIVDTGMSAYYKGTRSYLRLDGEGITAINDSSGQLLESRP